MKLPRFQFRLRTLMIVVTLLAVACAYFAQSIKVTRVGLVVIDSHQVRHFVRFVDF